MTTLDDIMKKLGDLDAIRNDIQKTREEISSIKQDVTKLLELETKVGEQGLKIVSITERLDETMKKVDVWDRSFKKWDDIQRKKNLLIYNWAPPPSARLNQAVLDFLRGNLKLEVSAREIEHATFFKKGLNKTKPVFVTLTSRELRAECLRAAKNLKGTDIYLRPDLPENLRIVQKELNEYRKKALKDGQAAFINWDKLKVNGEEWSIEELRSNFEGHGDGIEEQGNGQETKMDSHQGTSSNTTPNGGIREQPVGEQHLKRTKKKSANKKHSVDEKSFADKKRGRSNSESPEAAKWSKLKRSQLDSQPPSA